MLCLHRETLMAFFSFILRCHSNAEWITFSMTLCYAPYPAQQRRAVIRVKFIRKISVVPFGGKYIVSVSFIDFFVSFVSKQKHELRIEVITLYTANMVFPHFFFLFYFQYTGKCWALHICVSHYFVSMFKIIYYHYFGILIFI